MNPSLLRCNGYRAIALALTLTVGFGRPAAHYCGTFRDSGPIAVELHRKAESRRAASGRAIVRKQASERRDADIGEIAVIEADDSIISRNNPFNLDGKQLTFTPSGAKYRYRLADGGFEPPPATGATRLNLGDDDTTQIRLPFSFPFYGRSYNAVWVNSDGNLTFDRGDDATADRNLGRMQGGPPRIAGLFTDLDPSRSGAITVTAAPDRTTITWRDVPEYTSFGVGRRQNMQMRLYPDGRIEVTWAGVGIDVALVGISPGPTGIRPTLVDFVQPSTQEYDGMVAERFGSVEEVDLVSAAQRFYETHDDAYDYLAFFNTANVAALPGAVAYQNTVRGYREGIGDRRIDLGADFGSPRRLQSVQNMGPLSQYPLNPNDPIAARRSSGDTGLTVVAHEMGHLFLALASVRDLDNPDARPMLGGQASAHWNFAFNSEASLLEGNRISDAGEQTRPRFTTTGTVEGFSPLDQYLMGMRAPEEVPPTFYVTNTNPFISATRLPQLGVSFNGQRRDVTIQELIQAEGRRTPDHTVEQRRYRIAFVLITPQGQSARPEEISQLERYRTELESAFRRYTSNRASVETTLRRMVRLSAEPATGSVIGRSIALTISVQKAPAAPLNIALQPQNGFVSSPSSVTIPAGATSVSVSLRAEREGVELLRAIPADPAYAETEARIRVAGTLGALQLRVISGDRQVATPGQPLPLRIVVKLTDENNLSYAGFNIAAAGGTVSPTMAATNEAGEASFTWTPGSGPSNLLRFTVDGNAAPATSAIALSRPALGAGAVVNAASFQPGISPGGIASIFGFNLRSARVFINNAESRVFFTSDSQINFAVPATLSGATANIVARTSLGDSEPAAVPVLRLQPAVFFDVSTGRAAAIPAGQRIFEIYGTGFGPLVNGNTETPVTATVGGQPAEVLFSGAAPSILGLYQINIRIAAGVAPGEQPLVLSAGGSTSNPTRLLVP